MLQTRTHDAKYHSQYKNVDHYHECSRGQGDANSPRFGITLQAGRSLLYGSLLYELRIPPLYESLLFEKEEYFHPASHYSSRRKNTSTLRVITLRGERILPIFESLCFNSAVNRQPGFRRWDS